MADFETDRGEGRVNPVLLKVKGAPMVSIFTTSYSETNSCQLLGSPAESGQQQFDHKVRMPSRIQFSGIVKSTESEVFTSLRVIMKKIKLADILCEFQTKSGSIKNMIFESLEEVGDPNRYDAMEIRASMQEYLEHNPK